MWGGGWGLICLSRCNPFVRFFGVIVLELPSRLRVIERRGIAAKLELLHQFLRPAILPFQQVSEEYLEVDQLRCLVLVSARRLLQQPLKSIPRLDVILISEWNVCQIELRLAKFRIGRESLFKEPFGLVVLLLFQQYRPAQIKDLCLVWFGCIRLLG